MPGFPGNSLFEGPSLQAALLEVIVPYISCWRFSPVSLPAFWHGLRRRRGRAATRDLKDQVFLGFVNNEVQLCWWLNRNWPLDFRHCSCQGCWESYSFPRFRWFDKPGFGFCLSQAPQTMHDNTRTFSQELCLFVQMMAQTLANSMDDGKRTISGLSSWSNRINVHLAHGPGDYCEEKL